MKYSRVFQIFCALLCAGFFSSAGYALGIVPSSTIYYSNDYWGACSTGYGPWDEWNACTAKVPAFLLINQPQRASCSLSQAPPYPTSLNYSVNVLYVCLWAPPYSSSIREQVWDNQSVIGSGIACPANSTGTTTCTCNTGYVPDSTGTSCVSANNCPANMSGSPCACNAGFVPNASGSCDAEVLTITLSGGTSVEPWNSDTDPNHANANLSFKAVVTDQNGQPQAGVDVTVTSVATPNKGGHDHDNNRPKGWLAETPDKITSQIQAGASQGSGTLSGKTDGSGTLSFTFGAEEASGEHVLNATCTGCDKPADPVTIDVMVAGLSQIPASLFYTMIDDDGTVIGAVLGKHTDNHYLTSPAASVLWSIAAAYHVEQKFYVQNLPPPVLHLNDASLVWGGLLDVDGDWYFDHHEHRRGTVVDIRANSATGAIPSRNFVNFELLAIQYGADPHFENKGKPNQHYHLRIFNRKE